MDDGMVKRRGQSSALIKARLDHYTNCVWETGEGFDGRRVRRVYMQQTDAARSVALIITRNTVLARRHDCKGMRNVNHTDSGFVSTLEDGIASTLEDGIASSTHSSLLSF